METTILDTSTEPLIAIDDYARQEQVSRRTINRYVKLGKVHARKIKGRTFVVDMPIEQDIIQPASVPETQNRTNGTVQVPGTSHLAIPIKNDWIAFGAAQAYAKSRHKWQVAFFVAAVLLFIALVVGAGAGVWSWQNNTTLTSQIDRAEATIAELKQEAIQVGIASNAVHTEAVGRLEKRIDELVETNQQLMERTLKLTEQISASEKPIVQEPVSP